MKYFLSILLFTSTFFFYLPTAKADYVLPYPSTMPGGISYKIHVAWEKILQFWYFGNFGQFDYSLKEADKYLVEAKTLFEYNQYLLGAQALEKSDNYFTKTLPFLKDAQKQGKDISEKRQLLTQAAQKHREVLTNLVSEVPSSFYWQPEKIKGTQLNLVNMIRNSIKIRQQYL